MENYDNISLFRFGIIAPLVNKTNEFKSINEYCSFIADKNHVFKGKELKISKSTVRNWYDLYNKYGLKGLSDKTRSDCNVSRKLNNETVDRIIELREQFPNITGTKIYQILIKEFYIKKSEVSLSTILRFLKKNDLKANQVCNVERRAFEHEFANDSWQADTSHGPYLTIDNKKYKTYLIMFIDDKSRLITGFDFFFNDNAVNMQKVFKDAINTYGIPKQLFVDNGSPYKNEQLSLICASLGTKLVHARPYSGASKGKIERSFRTIKDGWMRCFDWNNFDSLEDIKKSLLEYLYSEYNNKFHSSINDTPNSSWHKDYEKIRAMEIEEIDDIFLHRKKRKVRNDSTIQFENKYYEVPYKYIGKTIEFRYDPHDLNFLFIFDNKLNKEKCTIIDKIANSKIKRKNNIDYSKVINNDLDAIEMEEE